MTCRSAIPRGDVRHPRGLPGRPRSGSLFVRVLAPAVALVALAAVAAGEQEVRAVAQLDNEQVLLGHPVGFSIVVFGVGEAEGPELAAFGADFDVVWAGGADRSRRMLRACAIASGIWSWIRIDSPSSGTGPSSSSVRGCSGPW